LKLVNDVTGGDSRGHPANPGKLLGPWQYGLLLEASLHDNTCVKNNIYSPFFFSRAFVGRRISECCDIGSVAV